MTDGVFEGLHHAQLAMPRGAEEAARAFAADFPGCAYAHDPFGNRLEFLQSA